MHQSTLNMGSKIMLMCCFSLFTQLGVNQIPQIEWQHSYGGPAGDYPQEIQITKDGGFIVTGYTEAEGGDVEGCHGNTIISDIWVLKLNASGNIQWKRTLGGDCVETSFSGIRQTADGGYILAGTSASVNCEIPGNHGGTDIWVVRLTGDGDIIWNKSFGGSRTEYASAIAITPDGEYVIAGSSESNDGDLTKNNGDRDAWIIKLSDSGNLIWQQNFGGSGTDEFLSVDVLEDGSYVAAGYTFSRNGDVFFHHGERDFFVVKLQADGSTGWIKTYGGTMHDVANGVAATSDGGCILTGSTSSNDGDVSGNHQSIGTFSDFWVLKIDKSGNIQQQKCYGGQFNEIANSITLTPDGGYLIAGSAESPDGDLNCNTGATDCWVIKINDGGIILWQKSFGGSYHDEARSAQALSDGSVIVAGETCSPEINGYHNTTIQNGTCSDFWIVKLSVPTLIISKPKVEIDKSSRICNGRATLKASAKFAGTKYRFEWLRNGLPVNSISAEYTASDFKNGDVIVCKMTTGGPCEDVNITTVSDTFKIQNNPDNIQPVVPCAIALKLPLVHL